MSKNLKSNILWISLTLIFLLMFSGVCYSGRELDGDDDKITIADDDSLAPLMGGITIMSWVYFPATADGLGYFFRQYEDANDALIVAIDPVRPAADSVYISMNIRSITGNENWDGDVDVGIADIRGVWRHLAFVRPANGTDNLYIYLDAKKFESSVGRVEDSSVNPAAEGVIGFDTVLNMILDDYVIIKRELTQAEVIGYMGRRIHAAEDDMAIYYPMDEVSGNVQDKSFNNNTGVPVGTLSVPGAPIPQVAGVGY